MTVRFVNDYCNNASYVIVTDDDVLINLWEVVKTLKLYLDTDHLKEELERTIFCHVFYHPKVVRDPRHRW